MADASPKKRRLKNASYKSFRLSKRLKTPRPKLPSAWALAKASAKTLKLNWKLFGGISLVYTVLLLFLVRGFTSGQEIATTKTVLETLSNAGNAGSSIIIFSDLLTGSAATSEVASLYQAIIFVVCSLAFIWAFRQVHSKKTAPNIRIRDAFYKGMYPLIPVLLVGGIIILQLAPLVIAGVVYSAMVASGLAVTFVEQACWLAIAGLLILLSLYMLGASSMAVFAATLPDVSPLEALRGAKKYVQHRRFVVIAKLLWLSVAVLLMLGIVVLPIIAFIPVAAEFVFFLCSVLILPFTIGYMYNLYRALLK